VQNDPAVVNPQKTQNSPDIGPVAVMAATRPDLDRLCRLLNFNKDEYRRLFLSRLYVSGQNPDGFSIIGPFVGAPYAVMLLENLIAWGARRIIFVGWCGAISEKVKIGDLILPTCVHIDEGTSKHYGVGERCHIPATSPMVLSIRKLLVTQRRQYHEGPVWTTDAIYRETRREVTTHRQNGILAVDMEFSALCSVAQFRQVDLTGILVVSDELSSLNWRPGFKHERFRQSRKTVGRLIKEMIRNNGLCRAQ
jgi:purine-nucleoside phosphorylase